MESNAAHFLQSFNFQDSTLIKLWHQQEASLDSRSLRHWKIQWRMWKDMVLGNILVLGDKDILYVTPIQFGISM